MKSKQIQLNNSTGLYLRLSKDDERAGESLSIENQRRILTEYALQNGMTIYDEYADDGYSGTNFERPAVKRLLEDAKEGRINTILVKDLSRFGRNYIQVGQFVDYLFPCYGIRFIALSDNIDTADRNSTAMDMMPIMNVFNEWHSANTSKKIRAVFEANAKAGKCRYAYAPYGYLKGENERHLPIVDEETALIVRRIFEMRAAGLGKRKIAWILTEEGIETPGDNKKRRFDRDNIPTATHCWSGQEVLTILNNPVYLGHLALLKQTTVSYKNRKVIHRPTEDWVIFENTHEPIISQELWDKVREVNKSVSRGKAMKSGEVKPLSGLIYCPECGKKMRIVWNRRMVKGVYTDEKICAYNCGGFMDSGKHYCNSKQIREPLINEIVLRDIVSKANFVLKDEGKARAEFLQRKMQQTSEEQKTDAKKLKADSHRYEELGKLIQSVYEDKALGRIPEEVCIELMQKYQAERNALLAEIAVLDSKCRQSQQNIADVDEFISRIKRYCNLTELTREICIELIEYITVGINPKDPNVPREIHIYYKLIDNQKPTSNRTKII